jgi:two-component system sensor histidine kinase KdpD
MKELYRYAAALNFVIIACVLTFILKPYILHASTGFFALAVLLCSLTLGMGPALASAILSVALVGYFFMEPLHSFHVSSGSDLMRLAFLLIMAITVSSVSESKHRLERVMESIFVLRGIESQMGICRDCSRIQGFRGDWLSLVDVVKRTGIPLVAKTCPDCESKDKQRMAIPQFSSGDVPKV